MVVLLAAVTLVLEPERELGRHRRWTKLSFFYACEKVSQDNDIMRRWREVKVDIIIYLFTKVIK